MAAETVVNQSYTTNMNVSVTVRDGRIDKVTTWVTGISDSTRTTESMPEARLKKNGYRFK